MEQIARNHDSVRRCRNHPVDSSPKSLSDICLTLIDAACRLPVVLPDAEVRISDVGEFHGWRMKNETGKGKQSIAASAVHIVSVPQGGNSPSRRGNFARYPAAQAGAEKGEGIGRPLPARGCQGATHIVLPPAVDQRAYRFSGNPAIELAQLPYERIGEGQFRRRRGPVDADRQRRPTYRFVPGVASSSPSIRPYTTVPALPTTRRWTWERNCWAENSTRPRYRPRSERSSNIRRT